ncbi:MAG: LysE family transporter [Pseudomonadota bacterium]
MDISLLMAILLAGFIGAASPGPATVTIATTSASHGTRAGLALALGIVAGSFTWSISAALGLSALMISNAWALEIIRYAGALYLLYLAWKSAHAAWAGKPTSLLGAATPSSHKALFAKGLLLHLTNPKAILFFGALYAFVLKPGEPWQTLVIVVTAIGIQSTIIFLGYALLFSRPKIRALYARSARGIQAACAVVFGGFALRLLTAKLAI